MILGRHRGDVTLRSFLSLFRIIHFDFEESLGTDEDIDALENLLCKYDHLFSKRSTDLGHLTVDPFRIILKKDAQPAKQPDRHSPVLAAKVQTQSDELVFGRNFAPVEFELVFTFGCNR